MIKQGNVCEFNIDQSHVCIYKQCKNDRIACIKCLNDIHSHQTTEPYFLTFENFLMHIDIKMQIKQKQYQFFEKLISKFQRIKQPCQMVNQCLQLLKKSQIKHIEAFKAWENRFILDRSILSKMIKIDDDSLNKDYQKIQEFLKQIKQNGIYIENEQGYQKEKQLQLDEEKCFEIQNENYGIRGAAISPDGKYLATYDVMQLQIFQIKQNKCIENRNHNGIWNLCFTNNSRFYIYHDYYIFNFQEVNKNRKQIFRFQNTYYTRLELFLFPQDQLMIHGECLTIMDLWNRQKKQIKIDYDAKGGIDYDKQRDVIVCGDVSQIIFVHKTSCSVLFKHKYYYWLDDLKLIDNYLLTSDTTTIILSMINYEKQQLYQINRLKIGRSFWLYKIWDFDLILVLTKSGITILNLDFEFTQDIEFNEVKDLIIVNKPQSSSHFILCKECIIILTQKKYFFIENRFSKTSARIRIEYHLKYHQQN